MSKQNIRGLLRCLGAGFLLAAVVSLFPFTAAGEELPEQVLRLHVVANSDSAEDQALKLKVRDAVLREAAKYCEDAKDLEEANAAVCLHLESIRAAAEQAVAENGSTQAVRAQVTELYFPTRDYESFSLPAGRYRALRISLGQGKGHNWWCVIFPALCLPAAEERPDSQGPLAFLPDSQRELVEHPQKYRVKFKAVELYEELRERFAGAQ